MSPIELDPDAALLVVDVQRGTLPNARAVPADQLIDTVGTLVDAFRSTGRRVVFGASTGTPAGRTSHGPGGRSWPAGFSDLDERVGRSERDLLLQHVGWSLFAGTGLAELLAAGSTRQVVIVGLATTYGVESTARAAYDLGLEVIVAADAVSDPDPDGHERTLRRVIPALGRVTSASSMVLAAADGSRPADGGGG